jgi:uncharacterized protein (DUF2236 family)
MPAAPVQHPITRSIWGDGDTVLLIFAGAAAEFALNRAADWLLFTGALPGDPVGRLFRTVRYAQSIAFASPGVAQSTLERIRQIHAAVERRRGGSIPGWAHRAVLYMLIHYSEKAAELLRGGLTREEREALYADFRRIGEGLGIRMLPAGYEEWAAHRAFQLQEDLAVGPYTAELYRAYRRHLGAGRYALLRWFQAVLVPPSVHELLDLPPPIMGGGLLGMWRSVRALGLGRAARRVAVPAAHWDDLGSLEQSRAF